MSIRGGVIPLLLLLALAPDLAAAPTPDREMRASAPEAIEGGSVVDTRALLVLLHDRGAVLLDVAQAPRRPSGLAPGAPWLPQPHEDIPGSVWIPEVGSTAITAEMEAFFKAQIAGLTGHDRDHAVVVYCHQNCALSRKAAMRLIAYGYRHVSWYPGGVEAWRGAGLPVAAAQPATPVPPRSAEAARSD